MYTNKLLTSDTMASKQYALHSAIGYLEQNMEKLNTNKQLFIAKRIPERGFPKTSLTGDELYDIYSNSDASTFREELIDVANAAIKQYILDSEDGCRIDTEA